MGGGKKSRELNDEEVGLSGRRWQEQGGPVQVSKRHVSANCRTISANVRRPADFLFFRRTEHRHRQIDIYSRGAAVPRFPTATDRPRVLGVTDTPAAAV